MPRTATLSALSVSDLKKEIRRRERSLTILQRRRGKLARQLATLDAEITTRGGAVRGTAARAAGGVRRRARNESNLLESLSKLLRGRTMSVTEAAAAVQKAGYKTSSPNFRTIVNQTLLKKKHFKRTGRGMYTAV